LEEAVLEAANKEWVEGYNGSRRKNATIANFRFLHGILTCQQIAKWNPLDSNFGEEDDDGGGVTPYSSLDAESAASSSQGKNTVVDRPPAVGRSCWFLLLITADTRLVMRRKHR
jgi:hypothetical protein